MDTTRPAPHPIHTIHRVGIGLLGLFLLSFGLLVISKGPGFLSTQGAFVMGLTSNGLLATLSLLVGGALLAACVRGGPTASMAGMAFGVLFLLSGIVNLFLLGSTHNMLAFGLSNVVFSLVVGMGLLFTGAYGRVTGGLPPDSPYYRGGQREAADTRTPEEIHRDREVDLRLAEAERAVALHYATPDQADAVRRAASGHGAGERRRAFLDG